MNIDYHYAVIYVVAREAGLDPAAAKTVAHSCQYIDDATTNGLLKFEEGQSYERFASAHVMLDYKNLLNDQDRVVWAPFHFLPGAQGSTLDDMAVCRPDSKVAREVVRRAIKGRDAENALHRLGITLHTYVDTWAHQGFSGTVSPHNWVKTLDGDEHPPERWIEVVEGHARKWGYSAAAFTLDALSRLGHGAALHFPDMPWADWTYTNGHDMKIERHNLPDFMMAAEMACKAVRGFINGEVEYEKLEGLSPNFAATLRAFLADNRSHDEKERYAKIEGFINVGSFARVREQLPPYIAKGIHSWKWQATGIDAEGDGFGLPSWSTTFENSDYRRFHDAVKHHRFIVTQEILPSFGVRLA